MKFSVLLPTRNRLEYLRFAIASVLLQDYDDWEIIISDNDSSQDVFEYVSSLNDKRIFYSKTNSFISVTENWNRALNHSSGDYVIMLGDDDCLMKDCFLTLKMIVEQFSSPDLIYSNALLYAYPGVLPQYLEGHLRTIGNKVLWSAPAPFILDLEKARSLVKDTMKFRLVFTYNMQLATIHRSLIEKLRVEGQFFHSPYPDFYAMVLLMQCAKKIVSCPYLMTVIGITPKSYGFYYFNDQEHVGVQHLNNNKELNAYPELEKIILPGVAMNTFWLCSLESVKRNLSSTCDLKIQYSRYRKLQVIQLLKKALKSARSIKNVFQVWRLIRWHEILIYNVEFSLVLVLSLLARKNRFAAKLKEKWVSHPHQPHRVFEKKYSSILEVVNEVDAKKPF